VVSADERNPGSLCAAGAGAVESGCIIQLRQFGRSADHPGKARAHQPTCQGL
jgi:hypothetical protein